MVPALIDSAAPISRLLRPRATSCNTATSRGDIPTGSIKYETIFVVGMALFVMTLALNALSIRLVNRYRQVYE